MQPTAPIENDGLIKDVQADPEVMEYMDTMREQRDAMVKKEANRRIKKNQREITRLRKHAEECLISNNKAGYIYAIGKLRAFTGQSVAEDVLEVLWTTSREQVMSIVTNFSEARDAHFEG
ncbi:coil containing protein [Vibrio phage 1.081.O._10N.286.52.C2]|nr:coil containing protein [Vibrio phage 1.081.O._10N.286.52.C2]